MSENAPNSVTEAGSEIGKAQSREPILAYRGTFVHFLFGSPGNESILLHFLNAMLNSDGQSFAKSVEARNPFNKFSYGLSLAIRDRLYAIHDLEVLDQLTDVAWDYTTWDEFEQALKRGNN